MLEHDQGTWTLPAAALSGDAGRLDMSDAIGDDFRQLHDGLIQRRKFRNALFDPAALGHQSFPQVVQIADEGVDFTA